MAKGPKPTWYAGVCDSLLGKLQTWESHYDLGVPSKGRDFLDYDGKVKNKVTQRAHTIPFTKGEIDNLRLLITYYGTHPALVSEVQMLCDQWQTGGKLIGRGMKTIVLNFYKEHVTEIYQTINRAKRESLMGGSIEDLMKKSEESGKDLFEV